jgi:hypothetical protein
MDAIKEICMTLRVGITADGKICKLYQSEITEKTAATIGKMAGSLVRGSNEVAANLRIALVGAGPEAIQKFDAGFEAVKNGHDIEAVEAATDMVPVKQLIAGGRLGEL